MSISFSFLLCCLGWSQTSGPNESFCHSWEAIFLCRLRPKYPINIQVFAFCSGIELTTLHLPGKHCATELYSWSIQFFKSTFFFYIYTDRVPLLHCLFSDQAGKSFVILFLCHASKMHSHFKGYMEHQFTHLINIH